jgi:2-C-methyl-D-erythritol 4-phosphate cytidylyltransferase/2-C-methyl-D-erythritol 2,4-cyclodiphosphate synthase
MTLSVVVVAAGSGERLGAKKPKAFVELAGVTLLERSVSELLRLAESLDVVVVVPEPWVGAAEDLLATQVQAPHRLSVVVGGASRTESVRSGLAALSPQSTEVLVHDAARPMTPLEVFQRVVDALRHGAVGVVPTLPVVDTIVAKDPQTSVTGAALDRSSLAAVQTPQGFSTKVLLDAYAQFTGEATDDAEVVRLAGHDVVSVPGHPDSVKVTYPHDLDTLARTITAGEEIRVGFGVDVHAFEPGRPLVIAGRAFASDRGLAGHSDGDVVLHAIADALLAAGGLGDLGTHFGSDRAEYAGASSTVFVSRSVELLLEAGFTPRSVSVQYVGTIPRLAEHREALAHDLSALVGAPVNLSATTTDGLGLTGRGEGAAALATALVVRRKGGLDRAK